jgi:hypothetical protein
MKCPLKSLWEIVKGKGLNPFYTFITGTFNTYQIVSDSMIPEYLPVWPDRAPAEKWIEYICRFLIPMKSRNSLCESREDREVNHSSMTNHRTGQVIARILFVLTPRK